jgi:hypothetical protein
MALFTQAGRHTAMRDPITDGSLFSAPGISIRLSVFNTTPNSVAGYLDGQRRARGRC